MQTFGAFLVSVLAAGMVAAVPASNQGTVSVKAEYNTDYAPHGPTALLKAYRKYAVPAPKGLEAAVARRNLAKRQTGSAPTTPVRGDLEYLTKVSIGSPAQDLFLDFDTGSSDLWTFSTDTEANQVRSQKKYSPSKSSTAKKLSGSTWKIRYGDGSSSSGIVYTDTVSIGGFTVKNQAIESAQQVSQTFTESPAKFSGLLGLAFDSINEVQPRQQKTWFSNAAASLREPLFTADLRHQTDGTYNFGFIDTTFAKGPITYTPVDSSQGFWAFTSPGYAIGNNQLNSSPITGIADTGTTLLLLDDSIVQTYYSNVQSATNDPDAGYTFSCSETLPDFTFAVEGSSITIPGSILNFSPNDDGSCFGGLQSRGKIDTNIFGDVALKAALVVFDLGNNRLGWAQK